MTKKVLRKECRHVTYLGFHDGDDIHLVKENVVYDDGTSEPNVKLIYNFERPFHVVTKRNRNYTQKKEREHVSKLAEHMSRECDLQYKVPQALGLRGRRLHEVLTSPYLYGMSIPTESHLKHAYDTKYGETDSYYTIAGLDLETDVVEGHREIIINSISYEKKSEVYISRSFLPRLPDDELQRLLHADKVKYLKPEMDDGMEMTFHIMDNEYDVITKSFERIHQWNPDVMDIFNCAFDVPYLEERCEALDISLKDLWSHPSVPRHLRKYNFKKGRDSAMTEEGKFTKIQFEDQWHTLTSTAGFQVLDSMCTYRRLRTQQPRMGSYSLNNILKKEGLPPKVAIEGCEGITGLALHVLQQSSMKIAYSVYAGYDPYSLLLLDDATLDIKLTLPLFQGTAPMSLAATPSKKSDISLYFWNLKRGYILGTAAYLNKDDADAVKADKLLNKTLSTRRWIITVDAYKTTLNGSKCLVEDPERITNIRLFGKDEDVASSYPSCYVAGNICKETNRTEMIGVTQTRHDDWRRCNVNALSGRVNSLGIGTEMFGLPTPEETLKRATQLGLLHY